jgi:hypothetical protein
MNAPLPTERFAKDIKGTIECFDRIVLFGTYGSVAYPGAMESLLHLRGVRLIDYAKTYAKIGRGLRRMRAHRLLKKIAGTHRYYLTKLGAGSLIAARQLTERVVIPSFAAA